MKERIPILKERLLSFASALVATCVGLVVVPFLATANHPSGLENISIHSATNDEHVCIHYVDGDDIDFDTLALRIRGTLYSDSVPPGQNNWDATAYDTQAGRYRIYFWVNTSTDCADMPQEERRGYEIEAWVEEDTETRCKYETSKGEADGVNCVHHDDPTLSDGDPNTNPPSHRDSKGLTHVDYAWTYVYFNDYWVGEAPEATWRHTINHEFGHVLGLRDGSGSQDCPQSIMHSISYGCSTSYSWPQPLDFTSVEYNAFSN